MANNIVTNPFSLSCYLGPAYFCDRQKETMMLRDALYNMRNVTLISPRKIGKTGLIQHTFQSVSSKEAFCFYVDIYDTTCLADFTKRFAEALLTRKLTSFSTRIMEEIGRVFSSLRPVFSTDPLTGMPQCMVDIKPQQEEATLLSLFDYLEKAKLPCYVAIDEFQTIADYTDCRMEAVLRSHIQHMHNTHFIFSGSNKHTMSQMFCSANRPFYQSTQIMSIDVIDKSVYYEFALAHFASHRQHISQEAFSTLYDLVSGHTWYVQALLARLYQEGIKEIDDKAVYRVLGSILLENTSVYQTYCQLITTKQKSLLQAIAKERGVKEFNNATFLQKYRLGSASTVRSALLSLLDKELVFEENRVYYVYDRFFGIWLSKEP